MKLQWPIKREKSKPTISESIEQQLRTEGALTAVRGTEFIHHRSQATDEFLINVSKNINERVKVLLQIKNITPQESEELNFKQQQLVNFEAYRALKKSGMQFSIAGEDDDMSERYSAYEKLFARNWNNPHYQELLLACAMYLLDISYKEKHVDPAPTVIFQSMNPQGPRLDLSGFGQKKED